jgi:aryl-alcohol dehydrogenase-like predicted oxidoreductase
MKLGLGTVQFGTDYGISNKSGQTSTDEVRRILEFAAVNNINYLDTAPAYGNSESVLGANLTSSHQFQIVTKTNKIGKSRIYADDVRFVLDTFDRSLQQLQQKSVYGLLVHHPDDLLTEGGDRLMAELESIKDRGIIEKIGVSVYDQSQIDRLLAKYSIDLIQIPLNVFDQRLLKDGYLSSIKSRGIEIHVRSVFLQGILLMSDAELPAHLSGLVPYLQRYRQENQSLGISPLQAAVSFVNSVTEVDKILVGVNNLSQLAEIVIASNQTPDNNYLYKFSIGEKYLIDPSLWKTHP